MVKTSLLAGLLLGLTGLFAGCRDPMKVCSSHADCPGGQCVLGSCAAGDGGPNGLGLVGYIRSTTGTALALHGQGSHVYLGDWGASPTDASARGNLQDYDVSDPAHPVLRDNLFLCDFDCELGDISGDDSRLFVAADQLGVVTIDPLGTAGNSLANHTTTLTDTGGDVALVTLVTLPAPKLGSFLLVGAHSSAVLAFYDVTGSSVLKTPIKYSPLAAQAEKASSLYAVQAREQVGYLMGVTAASELKFETVDLSPLPGGAPVQMSELPWPIGLYGGPGSLRVQGNYVYVAASSLDTSQDLVGGYYGGLRVINVADPKHPYFAGDGLDLPSVGSVPWNGAGLDVDESTVYFVTEKGLTVIDVSVPAQPQLAASYPFPADFLPCLGGRAMVKGDLVYVAAFCPSQDGLQGRGGLAIYRRY